MEKSPSTPSRQVGGGLTAIARARTESADAKPPSLAHRGCLSANRIFRDLADMIGVYRETMTIRLDHLRDRGILDISGKEILILNLERLRAVAEEEVRRKPMAPRH
jgi:CRP-like cAMP-binding protein